MNKSISEFEGGAGTIYVQKSDDVGDGDPHFEVWFEDFCILGLGHSELEALQDAAKHTKNIVSLIEESVGLVKAKVEGAVAGGSNE